MKPAEAFTFTVGNATDTQSNKTILHNCIIYVICKAEQPKDYNKLTRAKCLKWHKFHDKGGKNLVQIMLNAVREIKVFVQIRCLFEFRLLN